MEKIKDKPVVMTIDDSKSVLLLLESVLEDYFELRQFSDPIKGFDNITEDVDLILLDLMMPELNGFEFLEMVRNNYEYDKLPVVVLTAKNCSEEEIAHLFEVGGNDYINKPFLNSELIARIKHHIRLKNATEKLYVLNNQLHEEIKKEELLNEKLVERTLQIKRSNKRIRLLNRKLKYYASHDKLTGFYNRRAFFDFLSNDIKRVRRNQVPLSLLMIDIDFFKQINDTHGHLAGDFILEKLSDLLRDTIREMDLIGRFGGEEFMILLPDTDLECAEIVASKILENVAKGTFNYENLTLNITVSIGVAQYKDPEKIDEFVNRVDMALYNAKESGRNCVRKG